MPPANLLSTGPLFPLTQPVFYGYPGPYKFGNSLNWLVLDLDASSDPFTLSAYQSLDNGFSFSRTPFNTVGQATGIGATSMNNSGTGYAVGDTGTINGGSTLATYQITSVTGGAVTGLNITNIATATGYAVGIHATTTGGAQPGVGTGLTFTILTINEITSGTVNNHGTGYVVNDTVTVNGGTALAVIQITSVGAGGIVTGTTLLSTGSGYSTGTNVGTSRGGSQPTNGTGLTVNINSIQNIITYTFGGAGQGGTGYARFDTGTVNGGSVLATYTVQSVGAGGTVTSWSIGFPGAGYSIANGVGTTRGGAQPGVGTGFQLNILSLIPNVGNTPVCVTSDGAHTLYAVYVRSDLHLVYVTLDISTTPPTWGIPNDSGVMFTLTGTTRYFDLFIVVQSPNVFLFFDGGPSASGGDIGLWAVIWNGATWSSIKTISTVTNPAVTPIDFATPISGGNAALFWYGNGASFPSGTPIKYSTITPSGTVTTVTAVADVGAVGAFDFPSSFPYAGLYDPSNDTVAVVGYRFTNVLDEKIGILSGTPSASPSWTTTTVAEDNGDNNGWDQIGLAKLAANSFAVVVNPSVTDSASTGQLQEFTAPALTGPWGAPSIFYDVALNPPLAPVTATNYEFVPLYVGAISSLPAVTFGILYTIPAVLSFCGVLAYIPVAFPPPPPVLCPPIFALRQAQPADPAEPNPPGTCSPYVPTTPSPTLIGYNEPLELQGS